MINVVIASASPRRRELLGSLLWKFDVCIPRVDESRIDGETPEEMGLRLSCEKARDVANRMGTERPVIAADTIVVLGDEVFGKPKGHDDAVRMLRALSGKTHEVITGVTLMYKERSASFAVHSRVRFRDISDDEIEMYISSGEVWDKAGAYAIQGRGALLIEGIDGDYYNVVGLPLQELSKMFDKFGIPLAKQLG